MTVLHIFSWFFSEEWKIGFCNPQPYFSFKACSSSSAHSLRASIFWHRTPSTVEKVEGFGECPTRGKNNTDSRLTLGEQMGAEVCWLSRDILTFVSLRYRGVLDVMWNRGHIRRESNPRVRRERIKRLKKKKKKALRKTTSMLRK